MLLNEYRDQAKEKIQGKAEAKLQAIALALEEELEVLNKRKAEIFEIFNLPSEVVLKRVHQEDFGNGPWKLYPE